MSALRARTATAADLADAVALVEGARASAEPWATSWSAELLADEWRMATGWVLEKGGRGHGFLLVRPPGSAWEISLVVVAPDVRRQGGLRLLLGELKKRALTQGVSSEVWLEVRSDNQTASAAYVRCGFSVTGRRTGYYRDGTDAILMRMVCL